MKTLQEFYRNLAHMAKKDSSLLESHSIDDAKSRHEIKQSALKISHKKT